MASTKLKTYRAKRNFSKTAEPSGDADVLSTTRRRFVIQKHAATRLHYDLRLELDGVFKSWAVTRGPSLNPRDKRLAVEVEDHPLDYGDFEGTIPKGEYGGGTVLLWDRGYWAPELDEDPAKSLKKGELKFTLGGKRLNGSWVLVRMRRREREKRDNWLLIKHDDASARADEDVTADGASVASGRSMEEIAAGKGRGPTPFMRKKATGASAVWHSNNTADPPAPRAPKKSSAPRAAMPAFIEPQLCRLLDRAPDGSGWGHEIKLDGYRAQLRVEAGRAALRTRRGLDWTAKFPAIAAACTKLPDCIIDGEICALDDQGASHFSMLQAAISSGDTNGLRFFAFDLLWRSEKDLRAAPLAERKAALKELLSGAPNKLRYVAHLENAGDAVLAAACKMSLEGVISKRLDAPYRSGRGEAWVKTKCRGGHEIVIGGWTENNGRFRSLLAGAYQDGAFRYLGRVGTGYGQEKVARLLPALKKAQSAKSPFEGPHAPEGGDDIHWVKPSLVAEIEFAGWTESGMVRQASFKDLRSDKTAGAVTPEKPVKQAKANVAAADAPILGVRLSHPDKILWTAFQTTPTITKRDLALYYEAVAGWMLPHLKGRPCSIIRAPDGLSGEQFFQRHAMRGASDLMTFVSISGDKQPYLQFDRAEALIAAAQIGALELHPWNCRPGAPETPGRLVFDLDPAPDVAFTRVIAAAREIKERLSALGLESVCKTTGGKGLHVVTPFTRSGKGVTWPIAKAFAQTLCRQMAADSPMLYLTTMAKKDRGGKIFLDYLRNDRTATAVAPLSPRARPGAPVSMPLTWAQVKAGLDPMRFTIVTAPALLRKSRPWSDYADLERPFLASAKKLAAASVK